MLAMNDEKFGEAVEWFEKASEVNPNRPIIAEQLAEARARASGAP
jgi:hypothetical protein